MLILMLIILLIMGIEITSTMIKIMMITTIEIIATIFHISPSHVIRTNALNFQPNKVRLIDR